MLRNKNSKYKMNLRKYLTIVSVGTFCFSYIIASLLVLVAIKVFYKGTFNLGVASIFYLITAIIAMIINVSLFWGGTIHLIRPLLEVNSVVKQVAQGDFKVKINRKEMTDPRYEYYNEIDELSKNVNKMAAELDSMEYMQKDFMSNVSHEVKTPIAAITGFTEILLEDGISKEERQEYLEVINKESMRISRLCENMLCMSRLDSQVIVTNKETIRLDEQIRKCVILLAEKWSNYDIDFDIELEKIELRSDSDMLHQIWINLIDNAIKYSCENKEISISAKMLNDETVEVRVKDSGIGIEKQKLEKIFDKFYQCEESHKKSGNGLGLSIVKRIVELLSGIIECESKGGIGTTMIVKLPIDIEN
ncbi:MAG: HAMP domain-containing sensor histidine kinase [Peptostreptococcaceae bacterium]